MFSFLSLIVGVLALHLPVAINALDVQLLEHRAATSTGKAPSTRPTTTSKSSDTTRTSTTVSTNTAQPTSATCFGEINTFPNGQTTTVCYDTTYYRSADLAQVHNYQTTYLTKQCEASCLSDSQCTAYALAMQLAADSDLATGVCFFYDHTPKPRSCTDSSKRRLFANAKGLCVNPTSTSTSKSSTSTNPSTIVPGAPQVGNAPGNPIPDYDCPHLGKICGPSPGSELYCYCVAGLDGANYCISNYADLACDKSCRSNADCANGYICQVSYYCPTEAGYVPTCIQLNPLGYSCATYPGLGNLIPPK